MVEFFLSGVFLGVEFSHVGVPIGVVYTPRLSACFFLCFSQLSIFSELPILRAGY